MAHCRPCPDSRPQSPGPGTGMPTAPAAPTTAALRIPGMGLEALGFREGFQTLKLWGDLKSSGNILERKESFVYLGLKLPQGQC